MTTAVANSEQLALAAAVAPATAPPDVARTRATLVRALLLLGLLVAIARLTYALLPAVPWPVHALLVGMAAGNTPAIRRLPGRELPYELPMLVGLIFVGAQVHGAMFAAMSVFAIVPVLLTLALWFGVLGLLAYAGLLPRRLAALLALGLSGFGVSAITAASVYDRKAAGEQQVYATTVVLITGALGVLVVAPIAQWLQLSPQVIGVWSGATLANTAEAVTAAAAVTSETDSVIAANSSAAIKLGINALQGLPILLYLMLFLPADHPSRAHSGVRRVLSYVPVFVWGFLLFAVLGLLDVFTTADRANIANLTRWLFLGALAGVGFRTRPTALARLGVKPALIATAVWVGITCLVLVCCQWLPLTA